MKRLMILMASVFFVFALSACGGGGSDGGSNSSSLDLKTKINNFLITDLTGQNANLQLSDSFKLSANLYTPNLTYVDYGVFVRLTNDLNSSPSSLNSYEIFNKGCLGKGDCSYKQNCSISPENNIFYLACDGLNKTNINNIVSVLPVMLYLEIAVCSKDGCNYELQHIKIEADNKIDNNIAFVNTENANISQTYTSNEITIRGINTEVNINVNQGKIVKNGIILSGKNSTVVNGDKISVMLDSSSSLNIAESMVILIGDVQLSYSVTTGNNKNVKDLSFINTLNADVGKTYQSNTITIGGFNTDVVISISKGLIVKNGIELGSQISKVANGDKISVKLNSALSLGVTESMNVIIGNTQLIYSVTTGNNLNSGYSFISNGIYNKAGTTYYYLTMPSAGNIDFTANLSSSTKTIYDLAMNKLNLLNDSETINLSAGSYIIKIYNYYSSDSITVYSTVFDDPSKLTKLTNGIYNKAGTTYYYLTMPSAGNIDFTANLSSSTKTIYDLAMNKLNLLNDSETINLSAGSYIIKIYNYYSSDSITVYSPVL